MAVFAMVVGWAAVLSACVVLLHLLLKYMHFRKCELAIPGPPSRFLFGNLLEFVNVTPDTVLAFMLNMWGDRTELSRFSCFDQLFVFVSDPDDLAVAYRSKEFANKARFFYQFMESDFPKNIVTLAGAEWKRHRLATQPAFHNEVLDSFEDVFVQEAEGFVKRIVANQEQDPNHNIVDMLSRAFMRTAMTNEGNEQMLKEVVSFTEMFLRALNERAFKPWLWIDWIYKRTTTYKTVQTEITACRAFGMRILKDRKEHLAATTTPAEQDFLKKKKTLLDALIDAQMDTKNDIKIEDEAAMDEIITFLVAAVDTNASILCSAFKCLSLYPDVQERLYAEVKQVLGEAKRSVTLDDVAKMTYLDAFLKETLRVLPPFPFVARQVIEETEFAGKVLPADTCLVFNIYGVHRDPRHWEEPLRFNPDRFSSDEGRHPYAYIPFSAGPRNCIGYRYASQLSKIALATTLRDYRVDRADDGLTDHNQLAITFALTLSVVGGAPVIFTSRCRDFIKSSSF